jgi:hypothetical protein
LAIHNAKTTESGQEALVSVSELVTGRHKIVTQPEQNSQKHDSLNRRCFEFTAQLLMLLLDYGIFTISFY